MRDQATYGSKTTARHWLAVTRPVFLLGSVPLALLGTSLAWADGFFNLDYAVLAFLGLLLWHSSANVLNEYYDYASGIDAETTRTPFSGGSGILAAHNLGARAVLTLGLLLFALALPIWTFFVIAKGPLLLPVLVLAGICVLAYTPVFAKHRLAEVSSGIGIGVLPVLALYYVQSGSYSVEAVVCAVGAGILMFNVHLLNEFPDVEADARGGRRTLPIVFSRSKASWVLAAGVFAFYAWVGIWVAARIVPYTALFSFLTIPLAILVTYRSFSYRDQTRFVPTLWVGAVTYFLSVTILALALVAGHA